MAKTNVKWICIVLFLIFILGVYLGISYFFPKKYHNEDFHIETFKSKIDKDQDGIDDQTDILQSVKEYIETKPKYKSKYYETGYPNDNYGVCTDVVAFGLLNAGYDLMELLNQDVKQNKEAYDIDQIDKLIDFRRVLNIDTYLKRNAISLTTDLKEIKEWQGGDIVVFKKHIGIISDNRNKKGVPFLIHHASPWQNSYEENKLEQMQKEIIGHYRISE